MSASGRCTAWLATLLVTLGDTGWASDLPPEQQAREALAASPRLQMAVESIARGEARQQRLQAGPHEFELQALTRQRKDNAGANHTEQEYGLARGLRWPWKYSLDQRIGSLAAEVGELSYLDAWHEAARDLLVLWFGWVQAEGSAALAERQQGVGEEERAAVSRRVEAGDAARLDLQLVEAEQQRLRAAAREARRDALLAREQLLQEFPALALTLPDLDGEPQALEGPDAAWLARIVEENHEVELAAAIRDEAGLAAERARRDRLADPVVGLQYSNNLDGDRRVVGLSFTLPLGGSGRSADAAMARSEARRAEAGARQAINRVESAARAAVDDARHSQAAWQDQRAAFELQQRAAETTARGYAQGEFDISTLLTARRAALQAQQQLIEARVRAGYAHARVLLDAHRIWLPDREESH